MEYTVIETIPKESEQIQIRELKLRVRKWKYNVRAVSVIRNWGYKCIFPQNLYTLGFYPVCESSSSMFHWTWTRTIYIMWWNKEEFSVESYYESWRLQGMLKLQYRKQYLCLKLIRLAQTQKNEEERHSWWTSRYKFTSSTLNMGTVKMKTLENEW